jgi:hypothetical protein
MLVRARTLPSTISREFRYTFRTVIKYVMLEDLVIHLDYYDLWGP